jgi:hypothetical protein
MIILDPGSGSLSLSFKTIFTVSFNPAEKESSLEISWNKKRIPGESAGKRDFENQPISGGR